MPNGKRRGGVATIAGRGTLSPDTRAVGATWLDVHGRCGRGRRLRQDCRDAPPRVVEHSLDLTRLGRVGGAEQRDQIANRGGQGAECLTPRFPLRSAMPAVATPGTAAEAWPPVAEWPAEMMAPSERRHKAGPALGEWWARPAPAPRAEVRTLGIGMRLGIVAMGMRPTMTSPAAACRLIGMVLWKVCVFVEHVVLLGLIEAISRAITIYR